MAMTIPVLRSKAGVGVRLGVFAPRIVVVDAGHLWSVHLRQLPDLDLHKL